MFDYQQVPKSKEYRDNFDDIFGSKKAEEPVKGQRYKPVKGEKVDEDTRA